MRRVTTVGRRVIFWPRTLDLEEEACDTDTGSLDPSIVRLGESAAVVWPSEVGFLTQGVEERRSSERQKAETESFYGRIKRSVRRSDQRDELTGLGPQRLLALIRRQVYRSLLRRVSQCLTRGRISRQQSDTLNWLLGRHAASGPAGNPKP
jgi:hypothetical protein